MSHEYYIRCKRCGESTEYMNATPEYLALCAHHSYPIWLARKAGWNVWETHFKDAEHSGLAAFLASHFEHGGFEIVSEYLRAGDPESRKRCPILFVTPKVPEGAVYESLCLPSLVADAKKVRDEIAELLVRIDARQDGVEV